MLLSMARMVQKRELESSLWFTILLNMKHIYIYISPAYFVYLLRNYCFDRHFNFKLNNFLKLTSIVLFVFTISFGPFIVLGQLSQLISRLFPFKRGLSHAYWAPNFWAFYNGIDKVLSFMRDSKSNASMTSGLVQQYEHQVLFNITPIITLLLVLFTIAVRNCLPFF
jgi:alpha-1,3-glucosyltransferase